jgi:hypothetical protein
MYCDINWKVTIFWVQKITLQIDYVFGLLTSSDILKDREKKFEKLDLIPSILTWERKRIQFQKCSVL